MIQVKKLVKRFGPLAVLKGLDLEVAKGEFVALLGPNGAGKTTLLRILASLARPTSGSVVVASYRLPNEGAGLRSQLGVVSHQPLLYGDLTAEENLNFFSRLYDVPQDRMNEVIGLVGLSKRKTDLVRTFSRGMQQRLAIGRAILHNPSILLLDEPHTGLDQDAGEILDQILKDVALEGRTVVMTSHDLVRSAGLADKVVLLTKGKITRSAKTSDLDPAALIDFYRSGLGEGGGA